MMTGKQRVLAAVEHQLADRTPITFDAQAEVYEALYAHLGLSGKEALFDYLGCDTWMVLPGGYDVPPGEIGKAVQTHTWGYQTTKTPYSGGTYSELTASPLAGMHDPAAIDDYPWPEADALDFSAMPEDIRDHGDRAIIAASSWGTWHLATHIRGMEDLLLDFALRPDYAHRLFDAITERVLRFLDRMLETCGEGVDLVYLADDYCSQRGPLFSPACFREFCLPYLCAISDRVHAAGKKFFLHVCGAVRPLLESIIEAGVDVLEPLQIRAEGMEPDGLKRDFGDRLCFYGGVDLQQVLCRGTEETVRAEVRRLIDVLGAGGGYVLGPGHTYIQPDAPLENILAMYDEARIYRPFGQG